MSENNQITFTQTDINLMIDAINNLLDDSGKIFSKYNAEPVNNSQANQELVSFINPDLVQDVFTRGTLSMESAADHLKAFADSSKPPVKTIALWTCVRGLLETSALAIWFLDPAVDARIRIGRSFAFRYVGFVQQLKLFRLENLQAEYDKVSNLMLEVEKDALALGFPKVSNKKGEMIGIAQLMPSITDLIGKTQDKEAEYRLLSAVAHGHHWAISQFGFQIIETTNSIGQSQKYFEKFSHPNILYYGGMIAVPSFSKVIWSVGKLFGWDLNEIESLLNTTYTKLKIQPGLHFWKTTTT